MYIHECKDWPRFDLADVRHGQGRLIGHMEVLQTLTADVLKSSEIEGEKLDAEQVRSSLARRLVNGHWRAQPAWNGLLIQPGMVFVTDGGAELLTGFQTRHRT
jgi:hypothetical protein